MRYWAFLKSSIPANTDGIEAMSHPLNLSQPTRKDEVTEINQREKMQESAPTGSIRSFFSS